MNREIYIEKREEVYTGYLQKSPCNSCGNKNQPACFGYCKTIKNLQQVLCNINSASNYEYSNYDSLSIFIEKDK